MKKLILLIPTVLLCSCSSVANTSYNLIGKIEKKSKTTQKILSPVTWAATFIGLAAALGALGQEGKERREAAAVQ